MIGFSAISSVSYSGTFSSTVDSQAESLPWHRFSSPLIDWLKRVGAKHVDLMTEPGQECLLAVTGCSSYASDKAATAFSRHKKARAGGS